MKWNNLMGIGFVIVASSYGCNNNNLSQNTETEKAAKADVIKLPETEINYLSEGKKIAGEAQAVLGKNLMNAINTRGTKYAVEFCNIEAIPLTDSMAKLLGASVKRVTDKPRNIKNQANEAALMHIKNMKDEMGKGEMPKPAMVEINGKMVGYYAIVTNAMCLKCHGVKGRNIEPETFKKISVLYPSDKATGYAANELRGMWVVEMDKR